MSDKTSQRTEEEMLDQTFGGYDEEMTVQTETGAAKAGPVPATDAAAKKKKNDILLYSGVGVAAVCIIGYKFLSPSAPQAEVQQPPAQAQTATQQAAPTPTVVASSPVVATTPMPAQVDPLATSTDSAAAQFLNKAETPVVPVVAPVPTVVVPVTPVVAPTPEVKAAIAAIAPVAPVVVNQEVAPGLNVVDVKKLPVVTSANNQTQEQNSSLISQFQEMLEKKYDPKFEKIEKSLDEQKVFNKTIEERLARLESGKPTKVVKVDNVVTENKSSEVKHEVKHVKKVVKFVKHVNKDILLDNNKSSERAKSTKVESVYPKIEIHSVYSGRVWTKNNDGTLSTYTVGDRLPTGEVIKRIDDEKSEVTTDKRKL
jgi:hypothetical protein